MLTRDEAATLVAVHEVAGFDVVRRREILSAMQREDWSADPGYQALPTQLREVLESGADPIEDPRDPRWDPLLIVHVRHELRLVKTTWLLSEVRRYRDDIDAIAGGPARAEACPCCGYMTLEGRLQYSICPVCFWEDEVLADNLDDRSPANKMTLRQARVNFSTIGACDPRVLPFVDPQGPVKYPHVDEQAD